MSIIFDATRHIEGPQAFAVVTVLVDPVGSAGEFAAPPTNNGVFFCFHENGIVTNNVVRASVVASVSPALADTHKVRVRVRMAWPAIRARRPRCRRYR